MKTFSNLFLIIIFVFFSSTSFAQGWQKVYAEYNNSGLNYGAKNIIAQPNGNFIVLITGPSSSYNYFHEEYYIIEIDPNGNILRSETIETGLLNNPRSMIQSSNGNIVIANTSRDDQTFLYESDITILDSDFALISQSKIDSIAARELVEIPGGGFWLHGLAPFYNSSHLQKLDAQGIPVGSPIYDGLDGIGGFNGVQIINAQNGGVRIIGSGKFNNSAHDYMHINEYDNDGSLINKWTFDHNNNDFIPLGIIENANGGFTITARSNTQKAVLLNLDQNGIESWRKEYSVPGFLFNLKDIQPTNDNQGYRISFIEGTDSTLFSGLLETDNNGNILWERKFYEPFYNLPEELIALPDGGNLMTGNRLHSINTNLPLNRYIPYIIRTNAMGFTENSLVSGSLTNDDNDDCQGDNILNTDSLIVVAFQNGLQVNAGVVDVQGNYEIPLAAGDYQIRTWLPNILWEACEDSLSISLADNDTIIDQDFVIEYNVELLDSIYGYVFNDYDHDCFQDSFETNGYEGWVVNLYFYVNNMSVALIDTTDSTGYYSFTDLMGLTNEDNPFLSFELPIGTGLTCDFPCWQSFILPITTETSINFNNGVTCDTLPFCPIMDVSIGTNRIRPCRDDFYSVNYCNIGGATAVNAYLEVTIDPALTVIDATLPWTSQVGNVYTFDVGDLLSNECGTFSINYNTPCDVPVGITYCSQVYAYPDSTCVPPNVIWDQSEIEITANCEGDSINFFIENVGIGNMNSPLEYVITEDNVLLMNQPVEFQLLAGAIRTVTVPVEGDFYRMEAMQPIGFPGLSTPISWVEGCGTGDATIGMTNQHPLGDEDPWYDIFCLQSVNSYDPNDKQGFPLGVDNENYIDQNEAIEYQIRFQNTGTAEAINIEIRDTLPIDFLNPATFRPGASSHDYTWDIQGNGIVVFNFQNINLPDSMTNETASQGFVQFKIQQHLDNPIGTEINNTAAIYFDNNAPIITNKTLHTIGEDYIGTVSVFVQGNSNLKSIKVNPNPAVNFIQLEFTDLDDRQHLHFELFDALGNKVLMEKIENPFTQNIAIKYLTPGVYFYQLKNNEEKIGFGKLIKL